MRLALLLVPVQPDPSKTFPAICPKIWWHIDVILSRIRICSRVCAFQEEIRMYIKTHLVAFRTGIHLTFQSSIKLKLSLKYSFLSTNRTTFTMHFTATILLLCATLAIAAPHGDWKKNDCNKDDVREGYNTGEDSKEDYKENWPQDWKNKWDDNEWKQKEKLFYFDAYVKAKATPDQVIANNGTPVFGQSGASGIFKYGLNIPENTICYNITLNGVTGNYSSPAVTATHIHEAAKGRPGPPRIVSRTFTL